MHVVSRIEVDAVVAGVQACQDLLQTYPAILDGSEKLALRCVGESEFELRINRLSE